MKELPIGSQDFKKIQEKGELYVDKTKLVHLLVTKSAYYFLSRPRRFGKSVLVSTLRELFLGNRELFKGLWIEDQIEWETNPVIHISFSNLSTRKGEFGPHLQKELLSIADKHGINITAVNNKDLVSQLIKSLAAEKQVVILIDEYDKPIVDYLHDMEQADENRLVIKEFFEGLKDLDIYLKFLFITGVSKFSKLSMFSGLNNLEDITIDPRFSAICGYTEVELTQYFPDLNSRLAAYYQISEEEAKAEVQAMYNGYSWLGERVYNPWAILNLSHKLLLKNYWSGSGNPEFLLKRLHAGMQYDFEKIIVSTTLVESHSLENIDYRNLLFQTGYLTLQSFDWRAQTYTLTYPNRDVKDALLQLMYTEFAWKQPADGTPTAIEIADALRQNDLEQVFLLINSMFSSIPHQIFLSKYEAYYHSIIHVMFSLMGYHIRCEVSSARGKADAVVQTKERIFIFEFKVAGTAQDALDQIKKQGYAKPYLSSGKEIVMLGVGLSKDERGIADWKDEIVVTT